ncbi:MULTISPECIES: alpha/beta hydrolase [unclassified Lentimicrobium]|uniref:alpha/beta hydrolase n=1 Tax=unclassified Lentimicrobium TaxID=2677434 RepID=UPI0015571FCC|nr:MULTISPECIES: alpha/beta hydrolase [unclassified Lentimicrobium]NPD46132.1 alpha/beta fold hydrolase [Lentimicrobium sp. S6]NPD86482.1 alpha/beta fold hydrolase [Lentimicrobium sp. L6]
MGSILISLAIYFGIASGLIAIDKKPENESLEQNQLVFDELVIDYSSIPPLDTFLCRDDVYLDYRYYPSKSEVVIILLHGSGWHSKYFLPLANYLSEQSLAHVYTPDLRGHGINPMKRGDIVYIKQYEDDLADLIKLVKKKHPDSKIILGGHSSGGGLAIRFAGCKYGDQVDALLLLTPYLKYNAPTIKPGSGGWTSVHLPRIIGLSMLNNVFIKRFNHLPIIDFNMPKKHRDGTETLTYSYRLNTGYAPKNYKRDFKSMNQKVLLLVGSNDEANIPHEYEPTVSQYKEDAIVKIIDNVSHMGLVMGEEVRPVIKEWIIKL